MRAMLIDTEQKQVYNVTYDGGLAEIYALTRCDCITMVRLQNGDAVYLSDNGLIDGTAQALGMFHLPEDYPHQPLAGYGLVVGSGSEGEDVEPVTTLEAMQASVTFLSVEEAVKKFANRG